MKAAAAAPIVECLTRSRDVLQARADRAFVYTLPAIVERVAAALAGPEKNIASRIGSPNEP